MMIKFDAFTFRDYAADALGRVDAPVHSFYEWALCINYIDGLLKGLDIDFTEGENDDLDASYNVYIKARDKLFKTVGEQAVTATVNRYFALVDGCIELDKNGRYECHKRPYEAVMALYHQLIAGR